MTDYKIILYSTAGVKTAEVVDFSGLGYSREVNAPGLATFSLRADHSAAQYLVDQAIVEIWRRNVTESIAWYCDFCGLIRGYTRAYIDSDKITVSCPGSLEKLRWRVVAYKAETTNRSQFSAIPAETVFKTLVEYNAGASATVGAGRLCVGTMTGITVEGDGGQGNSLTLGCAYDNLLDVLQKYGGTTAGGDFDLVRTSAANYQFRWYTGQLGTDRTATVLFALEYGNMADPKYTFDRTAEKTLAVVGGTGEASARDVTVCYGTDYIADTYQMEDFVDASNVNGTALTTAGNTRMQDTKRKETMTFNILQTPGCMYGKHYFLGDLVAWQYGALNGTVKVKAVSIVLDDTGGENITVETQAV